MNYTMIDLHMKRFMQIKMEIKAANHSQESSWI